MNKEWRGVWPKTPDGKLVITQSMVSKFTDCPREAYYSIVLGLRPRISSIPLTRGTWVHSLLEERANGKDWMLKHQELLEKAQQEQFDEEVNTLAEECFNIVSTYDWLYKDDPLKPICAELTVERPCFNNKALYRGRIDLIVQDSNGDIWLVDHKTHKNLPDWKYRELAFQHYSYLWAVKKAPQYADLGIPQPKGFIYDYCKTGVIHTPTFTSKGKLSRSFKANNTSYPVFKKWLVDNGLLVNIMEKDLVAVEDNTEREHIENLLKDTKDRDYSQWFRRDYMTFSEDQSERQIKSFLSSTKRLLNYVWSDADCVERNLSSCSSFKCSFQDLTLADLIHGSSELEQKTRYVTTDDPLDYYPNQKEKETQK